MHIQSCVFFQGICKIKRYTYKARDCPRCWNFSHLVCKARSKFWELVKGAKILSVSVSNSSKHVWYAVLWIHDTHLIWMYTLRSFSGIEPNNFPLYSMRNFYPLHLSNLFNIAPHVTVRCRCLFIVLIF